MHNVVLHWPATAGAGAAQEGGLGSAMGPSYFQVVLAEVAGEDAGRVPERTAPGEERGTRDGQRPVRRAGGPRLPAQSDRRTCR